MVHRRGRAVDFDPATSANAVDSGPYNFESIMHYGSLDASWNGKPTITRKDGSLIVAQIAGLSGGDMFAVSQLYPAGLAGYAYGGASIHSSASFKCLDVASSGKADGTLIRQWSCNDTRAQRFVFRRMASDASTVEIVNLGSSKCVDVAFSGTANGTQVWQYTCNNTNAQRFKLVDVGSGKFEIRSVLSNKCLDIDSFAGSTDGAKLQIWSCHGNPWQRFSISTTTTP